VNGRVTVGRKDAVAITARELLDALEELRRRFRNAEVGPTAGQPPTVLHPGAVVTATIAAGQSGVMTEGRLVNITFELAEREPEPEPGKARP
jgi:hypothetical protein